MGATRSRTVTADLDRSRVYAAEAQLRELFDSADTHGSRTVRTLGSTVTLPIERRFASVSSVQAYVDAVLALNWVRAQYPAAVTPVAVRERRGSRRAHYEAPPPTIAVPLHEPLHDGGRAWALRELVVLHELAHHLAGIDADQPAHGPPFRECLLTLVGEIVGPEAGLVLRAALHGSGL